MVLNSPQLLQRRILKPSGKVIAFLIFFLVSQLAHPTERVCLCPVLSNFSMMMQPKCICFLHEFPLPHDVACTPLAQLHQAGKLDRIGTVVSGFRIDISSL